MKKYLTFHKDTEELAILKNWLQRPHIQIRKSNDPEKIMMMGDYYELYNSLKTVGNVNMLSLAKVVLLATKVKIDSSEKSFGKQMANKPVSELRFRRLTTTESDKAYIELLRIIANLKYIVNLQQLVSATYLWNNITKQQLAKEYYI